VAQDSVGPDRPTPAAVTGQRVYDNAGIFSKSDRCPTQAISEDIERRTGAQVASIPRSAESDSLDKAKMPDALPDEISGEWVGRAFERWPRILFDMQTQTWRHGQVSLYGGAATRLPSSAISERQAIFDPRHEALLAYGDLRRRWSWQALRDIAANATPEHAPRWSKVARSTPWWPSGTGLGLPADSFLAALSWLLHGRDSEFTSRQLGADACAAGGLDPRNGDGALDGTHPQTGRQSGLVDLAARGCIGFDAETFPLGETPNGREIFGPGQGTLSAPRDGPSRDTNNRQAQQKQR